MVQVYTDKTTSTLKANAILAYHGHVVFLNFTQMFCRLSIHHGYTFVGLLPVCWRRDQ